MNGEVLFQLADRRATTPRVVTIDELVDEALNHLCDAMNAAGVAAVPPSVSGLLRHSISEAARRLEAIEAGLVEMTEPERRSEQVSR